MVMSKLRRSDLLVFEKALCVESNRASSATDRLVKQREKWEGAKRYNKENSGLCFLIGKGLKLRRNEKGGGRKWPCCTAGLGMESTKSRGVDSLSKDLI